MDIKMKFRHPGGMQWWVRAGLGVALAVLIIVSYLLGDLPAATYLKILRGFDMDHSFTSQFSYLNESCCRTHEGYLVWSPSCRIPDVSARHESIASLIQKPGSPPKCPGKVLSWVSHSPRQLHLSKTLLPYSCCISNVTRTLASSDTNNYSNADNQYKLSKCVSFNMTYSLPEETEFTKVTCTKKKGRSEKEVYNNMHAFIGKKQSVENKLRLQNDLFREGKMSVLLVGIDSISRLNMMRTMPKTVSYLNKGGWLNLRGYNKIDDNTFPNLMAFLTGRTVSQIRFLCWRSATSKLDNCPLIWKDFSQEGYITAYAEDEPLIGSFNYHKAGFFESPTDYYLRSFMLVAEKYLKKKVMSSLNICLGPNYAIDYILNYAIDFARTFRNAFYFSLFWMNSFSHNDLNMPSAFDDRMLKFFKQLETTGALNTSMVIFLSDHGMRFGKIRETYVGWLEERLPFIYFWLPEWFKKMYPEKYKNMMINSDRLTSPFDLYMTFQEILGNAKNGTSGCAKCESLFKEVPWNRSCLDAGITEHWCTCSEYKTLSIESSPVHAMVRFIMEQVNFIIRNGKGFLNNGTECAPLSVRQVLSVRSKVFSHDIGYQEYIVLVETKPGGGLFEATIRQKTTFQLLDTISRINTYAKQSSCINDAFLKKYCYCRSSSS